MEEHIGTDSTGWTTGMKGKRIDGVADMNVNFNASSATLRIHKARNNAISVYDMTIDNHKLQGTQAYPNGHGVSGMKGTANGIISKDGNNIKGNAAVKYDNILQSKVKYTVDRKSK